MRFRKGSRRSSFASPEGTLERADVVDVIIESRWLILSGAIVSLRILVLSFLLAAVLALLLGVLRQSPSAIVRAAAMCWVEFFRGVSTVVQLFWLYFALPFFGISLSAETAAILGLGLVHGAYGSEIVRGAIRRVYLGLPPGDVSTVENPEALRAIAEAR